MNDENKHQRFERLATKRVNNTLHQLRLIGNLSNQSNYSYTQKDINKLFLVIKKQLSVVQGKFEKPINKKFEL